jgi:uridine kinase
MKHMDDEVLKRIHAAQMPAGMRTSIIAIDGFGGAGKTTLATKLAAQLGTTWFVES